MTPTVGVSQRGASTNNIYSIGGAPIYPPYTPYIPLYLGALSQPRHHTRSAVAASHERMSAGTRSMEEPWSAF